MRTYACLTVCGLIGFGIFQENRREQRIMEPVVQISKLVDQMAAEKKSYLPFFNVDTLHCGVYRLPAGGTDNQQPHAEDEVYYIQSGEAKIQIEGTDHEVKPGSVIFVAAKEKHHFHDIRKDLVALVFFSKADPKTK